MNQPRTCTLQGRRAQSSARGATWQASVVTSEQENTLVLSPVLRLRSRTAGLCHRCRPPVSLSTACLLLLGCRVARLAKASPRQPQPCLWCSVSCAVCPRPPSPESNGWHWQRSCRACPSHNVRACVCQPCPPFVVSYSRLAFKFGGLETGEHRRQRVFRPRLRDVPWFVIGPGSHHGSAHATRTSLLALCVMFIPGYPVLCQAK